MHACVCVLRAGVCVCASECTFHHSVPTCNHSLMASHMSLQVVSKLVSHGFLNSNRVYPFPQENMSKSLLVS